MKNPLRRKPAPEPVEAPPARSAETVVLEACQACDDAAAALGAALAARRKALAKLAARRDPPGSAHIMRLFANYENWRSVAFHGIGQHTGQPQVARASARSFVHAAQAAIAASATSRRPEPQPLEETEHAEAL